jgi:hypothetical protein
MYDIFSFMMNTIEKRASRQSVLNSLFAAGLGVLAYTVVKQKKRLDILEASIETVEVDDNDEEEE